MELNISEKYCLITIKKFRGRCLQAWLDPGLKVGLGNVSFLLTDLLSYRLLPSQVGFQGQVMTEMVTSSSVLIFCQLS